MVPTEKHSEDYRQEQDSMGTVNVPTYAYYGAQTQRAVENGFDSGLKLQSAFIHALALIKQCAAHVNVHLGLLEKRLVEAIMKAAGEVMTGRWGEQFVVDLFQTGSGTSTHMNMNEV
ncbi:MAG: aspartate ammonia-lyase, partial [Deltaproteobacteria bacterium]|nr:aspartate ammonia-lyase [Deltaproteobacteria bacterium]